MEDLSSEINEILRNNLDYTLFSWTKQGGQNPISVERARGVYLYDRNGKRYLDFSSQLMNVNIGHGHPAVLEAVTRQMQEVSYVHPGMITRVRGELGKKIAGISPPNLNKTFFTLGGADAIENAIKLARVYTGRYKIISNYQSYHGATYAAISAGGDPRKFPVDSQSLPHFIHIENPYFYRCPWGSKTPEECAERATDHLERVIRLENSDSIAAILLEGESGSSGCIKYPPGYWQKVKAIADKYGILIIDDEVMSGFGRTGKWFAIEHHGVEPDIICIAKGLTSGYIPLGGVIVSDEIASRFNDIPLPLGLTYSAHAVACAAALATIKVYEDEKLLENATKLGHYLDNRMTGLIEKHPSIGDYRNTGLFGVIELVKNRASKEPVTPWNAKANEMEATNRMNSRMRELGMFTFIRWNWIFIAPPLCINETQIDEGLSIISDLLSIADQYCN